MDITKFVPHRAKEILTAIFMYGMGASVVLLLFEQGLVCKIVGGTLAIIIIILLFLPD